MKPEHEDTRYLEIAHLIAQWSKDDKRKVGAIIVRDGNILSYSYNGTPRGWQNETRDAEGRTHDHVLHAETQAIAKIARSTMSTEGSTLYCTLSPCLNCAKLISQVGIIRVVYDETYKDTSGLDFLTQAGVAINNQSIHNLLADPTWLKGTGLVHRN
jgi:dCMP deaminase